MRPVPPSSRILPVRRTKLKGALRVDGRSIATVSNGRRASPLWKVSEVSEASGRRIAIEYCTQCHWLLRAAWMAQELLSTFGTDLGEVSLKPGTGGVFVITFDGEVIWERKRDGGFPDVRQLKQRVRDRLDPARHLGHLDRRSDDQSDPPP